MMFEEEKYKKALMTLYTNINVKDSNALCQRWNWKDGVGSEFQF
jgi:DNA/RNA-binding domain of Phe-tRNA-synthetase-like protein